MKIMIHLLQFATLKMLNNWFKIYYIIIIISGLHQIKFYQNINHGLNSTFKFDKILLHLSKIIIIYF